MNSLVLRFFFALLLLASFGCQEDDHTTNELEQTGILGKWAFESRLIDNVSNLAASCCDTLEFLEDEEQNDLKGDFVNNSSCLENIGSFEINTTDKTISFFLENRNLKYSYDLQENLLVFSYQEDDNAIQETWARAIE